MAYSQAKALLPGAAGNSMDLARARHEMKMLSKTLKNWTEAEACFERALERWRSLENPWNLANTLGELAGLHLACGSWSKAHACLDEAWKLVATARGALFVLCGANRTATGVGLRLGQVLIGTRVRWARKKNRNPPHRSSRRRLSKSTQP